MAHRKRSKTRSRLRRRNWAVGGVIAVGALLLWLFSPWSPFGSRSLAPFASAKQRLAAGDQPGAMIDLQIAIHGDPSNREARAILGDLYLQHDKAAAALKELSRARELGASGEPLALNLTRALLLTGDLEHARLELDAAPNPQDPQWKILTGQYEAAAGHPAAAKKAFADVLAVDPSHYAAHLGLIRAEVALGGVDRARRAIAAALAQRQSGIKLFLLQGDVELGLKDYAAARAAYEKALALEPNHQGAMFGRAWAALGAKDFATVDSILAAGPTAETDSRLLILKAHLAQARDQPAAALSLARQVLNADRSDRPSLYIAAWANFRQHQYAQAEDYAAQLLALEPRNPELRRLLQATQLAAGKITDNGDFATSRIAEHSDPELLALLGGAQFMHGRLADSEQSLARAAQLAPGSKEIALQFTAAQLASGKHDEALATLLLRQQSGGPDLLTDIMVVLAQLGRRDFAAAVTAAETLVRNFADNPAAHNLLGYAAESANQEPRAREAYAKALMLAPDFNAAALNLARLDLKAGDVAAAKLRYDTILKQSPHQIDALLGLAGLALREKQPDQALALLEQAREHNAGAVTPRVMLANHYRHRGEFDLAERIAIEAHDLAPYAFSVQYEYALTMLAVNKPSKALPEIQALLDRFPKSIPLLRLLAATQNRLNDTAAMTKTLAKILEIAPDDAPSWLALGKLDLQAKDFAGARQYAEKLLRHEHGAAGHELHGDVARAQNDIKGAASEYAAAFAAKPSPALLVKLDATERRAGISKERFAQWLAEHPDDLDIRTLYAMQLQSAGRERDAIKHFERVVQARADDAMSINNLAWLYFEIGDPRALTLAERGYKLASTAPAVADTYGWILYSMGKYPDAYRVLKGAFDRAPTNPDIRFHYASSLTKVGQSKLALNELRTLLKENASFTTRDEAAALLSRLDSGEN